MMSASVVMVEMLWSPQAEEAPGVRALFLVREIKTYKKIYIYIEKQKIYINERIRNFKLIS